jgi:superfamily II DNA helicase RecQ
MDLFNTIFQYFPEYHILLCKGCHQGVLQPHLKAHLDTFHKSLQPKTRKDIIVASKGEHTMGWAETKEDVMFPMACSPPIPYLLLYNDGFQCTRCKFLKRTIQAIQAHCKEEHGWENPIKRGRPEAAKHQDQEPMWVEGVHCQKFQKASSLGRLFEVAKPKTVVDGEAMAEKDAEEAALQADIMAALTQKALELDAADRKVHTKIQADLNRKVPNPWLSRSRWAKHLKEMDRNWLSKQLCKPDGAEKVLATVCWAVECVIFDAKQASCVEVVGLPAMNCIARKELGEETNEKPFNALQNAATMEKYVGVWLQIVRYIWRTYQLEPMPAQNNTSQQSEQSMDADSGESDGEGSGVESLKNKRPPYHLTHKQQMALKKIWLVVSQVEEDKDSDYSAEELDEEQEEQLKSHVLDLLLALLDHKLKDNEYKSALVSATAVLGVDADNGWQRPQSYTPKLSAIVTVSRMLVLSKASIDCRKEISQLIAQGVDKEDAEEMAKGCFELVQDMAGQFMTLTSYGGSPSPMDWILRLRTYGMKIQFNSNSEGVIQWVGDTILCGQIQFSMPQLRGMIHGLVAVAQLELHQGLLLLQVDGNGAVQEGATQLPVLDWAYLVDNPAETKVGWSFLDDARNGFGGVDGKRWLQERVVREKPLQDAFVDTAATLAGQTSSQGHQGVVWKAERIREYSKVMQSFRQTLLTLCHMTGGQPPRGTEMVTIPWINTANGESRGVFIEDGLLVLMGAYHKNIGASGKAKIIHRYMPKEVGELVVYYLWLVLPFWRLMKGVLLGEDSPASPFIWEPEEEKKWDGPQKRKKAIGSIGGRDEMSHALGRPGQPTWEGRQQVEPRQQELKESWQDMEEVEKWNTGRVTRAIQKATLGHMGAKFGISVWRNSVIAAFRKYIDNKTVVKTLLEGEGDGEHEEDKPSDLQAGHGSKVANGFYGRPIFESAFSTESGRAAMREVSTAWHQFLMFPSAMETPGKRGSWAAAAKQAATEEELHRWKRMRQVDLESQLRVLLGGQAKFRSMQKEAVQAIMQQKSPVVAIMGTGTGKSVLFMLPALSSTGITIVVVPLLSLRQHMGVRCERIGIQCVEWDSCRPQEWAQVVLVTPEAAVGEAFGHFINRQRAMGRLDRIVVDECHTVLDSTQGWRSKLLELRNLVKVETQLVYLTATLKPKEEGEFRQLMGLPAKEECVWLRDRTSRKNIQYRIQDYNMEEEVAAVVELVKELKQTYAMPGKILVYCGTKARTIQLAKALDCVCYYRSVGSSQEKAEIVKQMAGGLHQVLTATNALGLGFDDPCIRAVVHVGTIRKMRDYAQESGRAGRDGLPSKAIIMRGFRVDGRGRVRKMGFGQDVEEEVVEMISGGGCMRVVIDKAMDGNYGRLSCEEGEEKCNRCQEAMATEMIVEGSGGVEGTTQEEMERAEAVESQEVQEEMERVEFRQQLSLRKRVAEREVRLQAKGAQEMQKLVQLMEEWKSGCQRCWAWKGKREGHELEVCQESMAQDIRNGVMVLEKEIRWAPFSCCFHCGMPQSVCESYEAKESGGWQRKRRGECQYRKVLFAAVVAVWTKEEETFSNFVQEEMTADGWAGKTEEEQANGPQFKEILVWFGRKVRVGGVEGNKMGLCFAKYMELMGR